MSKVMFCDYCGTYKRIEKGPVLTIQTFNQNPDEEFSTLGPEFHLCPDCKMKFIDWIFAKKESKGKWIKADFGNTCSSCGQFWFMNPTRYCPNCGAKMEIPKEYDELLNSVDLYLKTHKKGDTCNES